MLGHLKTLVLSLGACALLVPAASADSFGFSFGRRSRHSAIAFGFSTGPVCAPVRVVRYAPRVWVPGHYETVCREVWIEGRVEQVWVEPRFELRYDSCGRAFQFLVSDGCWRTVRHPGHYETQRFQVWVEGQWQAQGCGY